MSSLRYGGDGCPQGHDFGVARLAEGRVRVTIVRRVLAATRAGGADSGLYSWDCEAGACDLRGREAFGVAVRCAGKSGGRSWWCVCIRGKERAVEVGGRQGSDAIDARKLRELFACGDAVSGVYGEREFGREVQQMD